MRFVGGVALVALVGCKGGGEIDVGEDTDTSEAQVGDIAVSPTEIDLGLLFVGQTATADITVRNVGDGEVDVRLEVIGGSASAYTLSAYTSAPAAGASSVHTLSLTPTAWGDHSVSVLVDDQLDEEGSVEVSVAARVQMDADGDGVGSRDSGGEDCDDADGTVFPGAEEVWYDTIDQDCDGANDFDQDGDGYTVDVDCVDTDATAYPGAADTWYDGVDSDCAGDSDFDQDLDGDDSVAGGGTDCDDTNAAINDDAADEWYDGIDSDCDGANDYDQDGDGSNLGVDCDDTNATIYPGADEIWYDGVDQACDAGNDYDQDGDGVDWPTDCNDTDPTTTGPTTEVFGDGIDNDCNGTADDFGIGDVLNGVMYGSSTNIGVGAEGALSAGGDVTGNGVPDVYIGAYYVSSYLGQTWVVDGASAATASGAVGNYDAATVTGSSTTAAYYLAALNGPMGDIDDDGVDDLLAVASSSYSSSYSNGYAFAWNGPTSGTLSTSTYLGRFAGDSTGDQLGRVVVADIDGDGVSDVVTASPGDNDGVSFNACGNLAFFGGTSAMAATSYTLSSGSDAQIHGAASNDGLGYRLSAGDLDGDGYADLLAGAYSADLNGTDSGGIYVIRGNNTMTFDAYVDDAADAVIAGTAGIGLGSDSITFPGDLDGDGAMDIAISEDEQGGDVWVFLDAGALAGDYDVTDANHTIDGTSDAFGSGLAFVDYDGDGDQDLVVGADEDDAVGTDSGALYLFTYSGAWAASLTPANASGRFSGAASYDYLGSSLAPAVDLDADGAEDIVAGAPGQDTGASGGGAAYVILGW